MKIPLIIAMFNLIISCSPDKSGKVNDSNKSIPVIVNKEILTIADSSENDLSNKKITITVSYAHIACGCPQWFETKYENVPFLEGVERFYLEPTDSGLLNANNLWDGERLPLTLKVTGRFSKGKHLPRTHSIKYEPEKARIFWYNKITVVSPSSK